jgi:hypothetical protein
MTDTAELNSEEYRALLDEVFDDQVVGWTAEAEASERFPCNLIDHLGERGVFAHKWRNGQHPDVPKLVALAFALGRLGSAGIGVGVSLHDSAIGHPAPLRPVRLPQGHLRTSHSRRGGAVHRRV